MGPERQPAADISHPDKTLASPPQEFPLNAPLSRSEADVSLLSLCGITEVFLAQFPASGILESGGPMLRCVIPVHAKLWGSVTTLAFSLCASLLSKTIHSSTYLSNLARCRTASSA